MATVKLYVRVNDPVYICRGVRKRPLHYKSEKGGAVTFNTDGVEYIKINGKEAWRKL